MFISFSRAEGSSFQLAILVFQDTPSLSEIKWAKRGSLQGFLLLVARYIRKKLHLPISTPLRPDLRPQLQPESLSCLLKKPPTDLTALPIVPKRTSAGLTDKLRFRVVWNLYSLSEARSWQHFVDTFPQSNVQTYRFDFEIFCIWTLPSDNNMSQALKLHLISFSSAWTN